MKALRLTSVMTIQALVLAGVFGLVTGVGTQVLARRIATKQLQIVGEDLARTLSWGLGRMLEANELRRAQRLVEFATTTPEIQEVIVTTPDDLVIAASHRPLVGTRHTLRPEDPNQLTLRVPIIVSPDGLTISDVPAYTLTVVLHPASLSGATLQLTLLVGAFALTVIGAVVVAVVLATHRVVVHPLQQVVAATSEVAAGDLNTRVAIEGPREIAQLAASFNGMLDAVVEQQTRRLSSELRFRTLFEHLPMPMHMIDAAGTLVEYNEAFATTLGYGIDELIGQPLRKVLPPDAPDAAEHGLLTSTRDVAFADTTYVRRDGSEVRARSRAVHLRDPAGPGERVYVAWIDVSHEEQQARADALLHHTLAVGTDASRPLEAKLKAAVGLLRQAFGAQRCVLAATGARASGQGSLVAMDHDAGYERLAKARVLPRSALELAFDAIGSSENGAIFVREPFDSLSPEGLSYLRDLGVTAAAFALTPATGRAPWLVCVEFCGRIPKWDDGASKLLLDFGQAVAMVAESANNLEALEQAKREIETVFEAQHDGVAMIDETGAVLRSNQAYCELLRLGPRTPGTEQRCRASGRACVDDAACALQQALTSGRGQATFLIEQEGNQRWLDCSVYQVAGRPHLYTHVVRDVTEQRALSERATQQARLESLGTLAGGVAHEFNNILMGMVPAVERLRRGTAGDPHAVELIAGAVERAGELTRRMLALSRQHAGFVGHADLGQTMQDVMVVLQGSLPKNIRLESDFAPDIGWVGLDPSALHSVLLNLATNSRDAMPDGGTLRVEAHNELRSGAPWAVVTVTDTGVGIAPSALPHIFDPFFTTKTTARGTGLGLPLVHRLVGEAHGTVAASSAGQERGAVFVVSLPLVSGRPADHTEAVDERTLLLANQRVLIVDDEPLIREGVAALLRDAGARVDESDSAEDALAIFSSGPSRYDAVVADFGLPGRDGCALLSDLLEVRPQLVAILASGYTDTERFAALQARGVHFFQKPFRIAELIGALAAGLGSRTPEAR